MNWQVQKWAFLLDFLCRIRVLACSCSGLFNFHLLFAPGNCLEIVSQIRDFRGDCLNFWLFIKKKMQAKENERVIWFWIFTRKCYYRSSHPEVLCKEGVLKNFTKFTGKHLCQSLFSNKATSLLQLYQKVALAQVIFCEFWKILRTPFFTEHLQWLPLLLGSY